MALTTLDGYLACAKQRLSFAKTSAGTTVAGFPFTTFALAGIPAAGTLAVGNTANGLVPTSATTGFMPINAITNTGYISKLDYTSTVAGIFTIYDRIFNCGAYAHNANTTLNTQPSFSARAEGYYECELWMQTVTAFTGNQSIRILYDNGVPSAGDTGTIATGIAPTVGRMFKFNTPYGVSKVKQVISTVSSAGTFNILVLRPLMSFTVSIANNGGTLDMLSTGLPKIYSTSAIEMLTTVAGTTSGLQQMYIEVADG